MTLLAALLTALLATPVAALAQDGPEELAKMALADFKDALDDKSARKLEEALRDFDRVYEKVSDKTRKKLHKAYGNLFALEVRQEIREDGSSPTDELLLVYQLGVGTVFDKDGGRELLLGALKRKHVKAWPEAQALFVEALGLRAEPKNVKELVKYLGSDHAAVVRAAVAGLGQFAEADVDQRREVVKPLVMRLVELDKAAAKEKARGKKEDAQDFLVLVEGSFYDALLRLTRQRFERAEHWSAWFDEHGAEDSW